MPSMQDLLAAYGADTAAAAKDTAAIAAADAALVTDEAKEKADAAPISAALTVSGPVALVATDGKSVSIYAAASAAPGFTAVSYPVASTVQVPPAAPPA